MQNELMEALDGQQEITEDASLYQMLWENGWVFLGMEKVPVTENNLDVLVDIAVNQDFLPTVQHLKTRFTSRLNSYRESSLRGQRDSFCRLNKTRYSTLPAEQKR